MFATTEQQNEFIEMIVAMNRQAAEWRGKDAQDEAEARVRFDWGVNTHPVTPWNIQAKKQIAGWREELKGIKSYELSSNIQQKISRLESELVCAGYQL